MKEIKTTPLISILVPVYNTQRYLQDCLESITVQTYTNFEAIIVDDGSTDQSGAICEEYALKDNRFKVLHQKNSGVTMARIAAFENSRGEYITFVDSDDFVSSDYLEKLVRYMIEDDADMVSCEFNRVRNNMVVGSNNYITGTFQDETLRNFVSNVFFYCKQTKEFGIHPGLATKMVKRKFVLEGLALGKDLWLGEDMIAVFYILSRCNMLVALPNKLYNYVEHDDEAINKYDFDIWRNIIEMLKRFESICQKEMISIKRMRSGIWKQISIIIGKMQMTGMTYVSFHKDLCIVRNHPYMTKYFEPWVISYDDEIKSNIGYLLLRMKKYYLLWLFKIINEMIKKHRHLRHLIKR